VAILCLAFSVISSSARTFRRETTSFLTAAGIVRQKDLGKYYHSFIYNPLFGDFAYQIYVEFLHNVSGLLMQVIGLP